MRKLSLLLGLIVVILLVAGGAMLLNRSETQAPVSQTVKPKSNMPSSAMNSLKDLLALNKSQMCTYEYSDPEGGSVKGVVYISGGKTRGDFTTTANGKPTSGSMINDSKYVYTWSPDTKQGFKMEITEEMMKIGESTGSASSQKQSIDSNAKYDYKCSNWSADNSKFTPPTDIKFTDYSSTIKQMTAPIGTTGKTTSPQCGACAYLTGDEKTACLAQYKCN